MKNQENTLNILKSISLFISLFSIVAYIAGFFIWNIYLNSFGFMEYDIIQTRFVLTGAVFLILFLLTLLVIDYFINIFKKIDIKKHIFYISLIVAIIIIVYANNIFPLIPSVWGGGKPWRLSIISTETEIDYLVNFGIKRGDGSRVQTENLCLAYENKDIVLILLDDRIIEIKKEFIKGFGSLPLTMMEIFSKCSNLSSWWRNI